MSEEPVLANLVTVSGAKKPSSYIVHLKDGVNQTAHIQWVRQHLSGGSKVTNIYDILNAYSGEFDDQTLSTIRASRDVNHIEEDAALQPYRKHVQGPAPWGLNRISQRPRLTNSNPFAEVFQYTYDDSATNPVDVYIIDTGINIEHVDFGGRARWGYVYPGLVAQDLAGHGTQVAGIAGGVHCGVYKHAQLIAVKTHDRTDIHVTQALAGMDYVFKTARTSGRPSVANLSWGFNDPTGQHVSLDLAVAKMTAEAGIHVCTAAGNSNVDARTYTPARATSANTVGATDIKDNRASFSNYGSVLACFAPGVDIQAPTIGSKTAMTYASGTSMASPYVAGLIAYLIALHGNRTPYNMSKYLKDTACKEMIYNIPQGSGTPNVLVNNGF